MGCCISNKYMLISSDDVTAFDQYMIANRLKNKDKKRIVKTIDINNKNYLIAYSEKSLDCLTSCLELLKPEHVIHLDNNNRNFLFYLLTNKDLTCQLFTTIINNINVRQNLNELIMVKDNDSLIHYLIKNKDTNIMSFNILINYLTTSLLDTIIIDDESILSYAMMHSITPIVETLIIKFSNSNIISNNINKVNRNFTDIFHLASNISQEYICMLVKNGMHNKYNPNIKTIKYKYSDIDSDITIFEYACQQNMESYVKYCIMNNIYSYKALLNNMPCINRIYSPKDLINLIINKTLPSNTLYIQDDNKNTLFMKSIIDNTEFYKILVNDGYVTIDLLKHRNCYEDNSVLLAARYNLELLQILFPLLQNYPEIVLHKNNEGYDFIDILTKIKKPDVSYYFNFFDPSIYDQKETILFKFNNMNILSLSEYIFLRYQYNISYDIPYDNKNVDDNNMCPICYDDIKTVSFDCKHELCFKCSLIINKCPLCRQKIEYKNLNITI